MPLIFTQERIGYMGRKFNIYKFKTMDDKENVYWWGKLLRATGLDELPQILNIFKGDMTLVGPRPLTPWDDEKYRGFFMPVKPGLTGWWQIHGRVQEDIHKYDLEYLKLREEIGFLIDLYIIIKTIPLVVLGKHG